MKNIKLPQAVSDFLALEEELAKSNAIESEVYNRYIDFFNMLYDESRNTLEDLKSGELNNYFLKQVFVYKNELFDKNILSEKVYSEIETIVKKIQEGK